MSSSPSVSNGMTITTNILQECNEHNTELSHNFGVSHMTVLKSELVNKKYHIVLTLDRSGSMMETLPQVKHTLKNMLDYLCSTECDDMYVSILFFDHEVIRVTTNEKLTSESNEKIMTDVNEVYARGSTDIGLAFQEIEKLYMEDASNIHIFMTDGSATVGEGKCQLLAEMLDHRYEHNFLGFGIQHNEKLLYAITLSTNGNYYFIDSIENAGLIYGEVLNKILFRKYERVTFASDTLQFYNYKNNKWESSYVLGNVGSEDSFDVNFRFGWDVPHQELSYSVAYAHITTDATSTLEDGTDEYSVTAYDPTQSAESSERDISTEKYYYRQRVLEEMFLANQLTDTMFHYRGIVPDPVTQSNISKLFDEIKKFMNDQDLTEDLFMKQLLDDLSITHQSFSNPQMGAFGVSRQISQGQQRAYNVVNVQAAMATPAHIPFSGFPMRQTSCPVQPNWTPPQSQSRDAPFPSCFQEPHSTLDPINECASDDISMHSLSQQNVSCYTSPQLLHTMSRVQQGTATRSPLGPPTTGRPPSLPPMQYPALSPIGPPTTESPEISTETESQSST